MSEPHQSLEEHLFEVALTKASAAERAAFLDGVCRDNPGLRARLEVLLEGHFQAEGFLVGATKKAEPKPVALPTELPCERIGRYKLLQTIGEGGCGVVYMAEQQEPVRRRVALKVIKLGMDTKQVIARFEAERQALALMDHPNIAKVLDAGATETGRPYFVMDLVKGVPITRYCDENTLTAEQRLRLFIQVCQAVQHAHQKGVIHRDLKPSNILVADHDGTAVPKIIDFGIAKATTDQRLTDKTLFTALEQFIGTPAYMSPEQAKLSGLDVDTRSDIYSLGVLLYELLTGKTPFDPKRLLEAGLDEIRRTIQETVPAPPSTRLSAMSKEELTTTAHHRGTEPPRLISLVRGDLDWIVMKCLEKDRGRRYETANGLARDIERHLRNEPVTARPPSRLYEFQKTVRRHWVGFAAAGAVVASLAIGVMVSSLEAVRARRAERLAHGAQAAEAKQKTAAQLSLYQFLLGEARATRLARRPGYRDQVFALLKRAKMLDVPEKSLADLRQEALACMGDFVGLTPVGITNFSTNISGASLAPSGKLAAFTLWDGAIELREMPSGKELARFKPTNEVFSVCFNALGDQLFALSDWPNPRLYHWASDADGRWREIENHQAFAKQLFRAGSNVLGVAYVLFNQANRITNGLVRRYGDSVTFLPESQGNECLDVKFLLTNPRTRSTVPGYSATNAVAPGEFVSFRVSGDAKVLAVEAKRGHDFNSPSLVNLYDWKTGERIDQLRRANSGPLCLSDDGKYLVANSEAGGSIYMVPGLERIAQFNGPFYGAGSPLISGDMLALAEPSRIRLWSLTRRQDIALLEQPGGVPQGFGSNEDCLMSSSATGAQLHWLTTPERLELPPHAAAVPGVAFSPDGLRVASASKDHVVRVCDALTRRVLWETNDLPGLGQDVTFSPDGQWLAIAHWDSDLVWVRDAHTGQRLLELGDGHAGRGFQAEFSPDGRYLATAFQGPDGIRIWALESRNARETNGTLAARLIKSWEGGQSLQFAPDSRSVAFTSCYDFNRPPDRWGVSERPLYLWDFESSAQPRRVAFRIIGARFTPDSRQLVTLDANGEILGLDVATGGRVSSCRAEEPLVRTAREVAPSPDCATLALPVTTPSGEAVSLLDAKTGKHLYSLPAETGRVYGLTWSPDSRRLAVCRDNGNMAIWNLEAVNQILAQLGLGP